MRVIFPVGDVSSKVHSPGQQKRILKLFENKALYCRLANPFLDTNLLVSHSRLSMAIWNEISQPYILQSLRKPNHRGWEKLHVLRTYPYRQRATQDERPAKPQLTLF